MVRIRIPGGVMPTGHARGAGRLAARYGEDWLHLTTRQNMELHWVADRDVPALLDQIDDYGLSTRSACGHTVRNVMASEDAGVGLDEPFDCLPDARLVSDALIDRSAALNVDAAEPDEHRPRRLAALPPRRARQRHRPGVDGRRTASPATSCGSGAASARRRRWPCCSRRSCPRTDVVAAVEAVVDVYVAHGNLDEPAKGRLKFVDPADGRRRASGRRGSTAFAEARPAGRTRRSPTSS